MMDTVTHQRPLVDISSVTVQRDGTTILDGVDLHIESDQIVTLVGPNGSGKTTLVRVVLGLLRPNTGSVDVSPNLRIGYVPQHFHVDDTLPMSVHRFLRLGRSKASASIEKALAEVNAQPLTDKPLQRISGGEMRRVLLARALLRDPELLVLDEPSAGLDIGGQAELYALIRDLRERHGCGVLLISHDLHLVMAATDHVVCLNHHVCCSGTPGDVSEHPEYQTLFGRDLSATHALYTHHHDHRHDLSGHPVQEQGTDKEADHG